MSKKANRTLVGAFVLGAIALMLVALAMLGAGNMFSTPMRLVMFFDSSLKGLSAGSSVTFRGVPIGRVVDIRLIRRDSAVEFGIPIFVELDLQNQKQVETELFDNPEYLKRLIARGIRARLNNQSLLTGQLLIELDYFAKPVPVDRIGKLDYFENIPVIPTVPSQLDTVWQKIAELPIGKLADNLVVISEKLSALLDAPSLNSLLGNANQAMLDIHTAMDNMNHAFQRISELAASLNVLTGTLNAQMPDELTRLQKMMTSYTKLADSARTSLKNLDGVVGPNALSVLEFNRTLHELGETARAIRALANTLERNPESLLLGKGADRR